ncbi:MAG: DUF502 domain-containing protein [Chlamydiota bacterium]
MKKYLLTGLVLLLPLALTLMVIIFLFDFFTTPFVPVVGSLIALIQENLPFTLPSGLTLFLSRLLSLIFLCIFIIVLGFVTQWLVVKNLISWGNRMIARIPIVKTVYKVSRDIFSALFSVDGKKAFKKPVMIPFPGRPNFCLGFNAGEVAAECQQRIKTPLVSVFAPTAPHPISGFLFLVPETDVADVDMTNEEVVKFLVSCGMIVPEDTRTPEKDFDEFL